ncbi:hypothetical protein BU17DRAFT_50121 [Hysterangium stoloniferum]|nr:hypothetical protein BU17DRAFT_50121 [Hysterangium stoloniferum]
MHSNPQISPDVTLERLPYSIDNECPLAWPSTFDAAINEGYPFPDNEDQTTEEYIIKRYLETLWLPESLMSLVQFVKTLRRLACSPMQLRAVHQALKPLLRSAQSTHDKYHQELPRILEDEGGAGEIEESMMWHAYSTERYEGKETQEIDVEKSWKKLWMVKMERRETLIQILLYLHILSLPPPPPCTPRPSPGKRKRKQARGPPSPERLETFMDKLSVWQMMAAINIDTIQSTSSLPMTKHDWMQAFCEDVVSPLFKDRRPDLYNLLRTKVFPHSPFSDDSDTKERRPTSPLRLQELEKPKYTRHNSSSLQSNTTSDGNKDSEAPQRHRSRSRSVSIAAEEVRARGASRGGVASSKTLFKGEIEMKRTSSRRNKLFASSTAEEPNGDRHLTRSMSDLEHLPTALTSFQVTRKIQLLPIKYRSSYRPHYHKCAVPRLSS